MDPPEKTTSLANRVYKSRNKSSNVLVKRDKNTVDLSLGSTIGFWDSALRPLEFSFSQMHVMISKKSPLEQNNQKNQTDQDKIIFSLRFYQNGALSFKVCIPLII